MLKDYCPGYIDLAAGGVVGMEDTNVDENAAREVEEELGIPYSNHTKPCYLFKFPYTDPSAHGWQYVYYLLWNGPVKP
jgi:8-oxo-dGTP pyrophosphatase MutT (NUDIX family)